MRKTDSGLPFNICATTRLVSLSFIYSTRNYVFLNIRMYRLPLLSLALDFKRALTDKKNLYFRTPYQDAWIARSAG